MHSEIQKNLSKVYLLRSVQVVLTKASFSSTTTKYQGLKNNLMIKDHSENWN